ncbi:MAG: ACT domain-containing protein [Bacilli bacterium]|jgi:chorismate mutase|nr:ACT domain-containing protein [Bacilli bacterium]MDD4056840.1 ACT domain-containing protein [Bacilli bacterium]
MKDDFLIVHKCILPEYFDAVITARNLINDRNYSVSDACKEVGISRNTYYKYKDFVFIPSVSNGKRAIFAFRLDHKKGVLSNLLNFVAAGSGNILAINQEMPIHGNAYVTITVDCLDLEYTINDFIEKLKDLNGVSSVDLIALE